MLNDVYIDQETGAIRVDNGDGTHEAYYPGERKNGAIPHNTRLNFAITDPLVWSAPRPLVEVPSKGDYVRLTMQNGDTHEGEVSRVISNRYGRDKTYASAGEISDYTLFFTGVLKCIGWIFPHPEYAAECRLPDLTIVKVEKIERQWKVGDTVPGYTKVNRPWLGEGMLSVAGVENSPYYTTARRIEWIAKEGS